MPSIVVNPIRGLEQVCAPSCQVDTFGEHGAWSWLLSTSDRPLALTAVGDLFVLRANGTVAFLDVGQGTLLEVASNEEEFRTAVHRTENIEECFVPQLVAALVGRDGPLQSGTCFSCLIPMSLNGEMSMQNYAVLEVGAHFAALGKLQRQILALPVGSVVSSVIVEP